MAPKAIQGATLKKDGRADAGAVVDRKPLDIKNCSFYIFHSLISYGAYGL